jgi:succinoglycan biosynthesis transport protein ExoP
MTGSSQIIPLLWRRRWTAALIAAITFAAVVAVTFALPRVYTSESFLLVSPTKAVTSDYEATQLTQILTKTYSALLQADSTSAAVDRRLGTTGSGQRMSVTAVPQSQLLSISAEGASPQEARRLADAFAVVFEGKVRDLSTAGQSAGSVSVAEPASTPTSPSRPRPKLYLAIGALLAVLAGLGAALMRERLDQGLAIDDSTTELSGLPIIGRLPRGGYRADEGTALAEAARLLLANLSFANLGERPRTIALVSPSEQEGKSTCSVSIGRAGAELGLEVLVVEADLRRPSLASKLELPPSRRGQGFASALVKPDVPIEEQSMQAPGTTLEVLPAGAIPPNPAALLASERLAEFDARVRQIFDLVVYDTPPFSAGADASLLAAQVEGVVLVVDAHTTRRAPVLQAVEQLRRVRANVLGIVVNRAARTVDPYYYAPKADGESASAPAPPDPRAAQRPSERLLDPTASSTRERGTPQ